MSGTSFGHDISTNQKSGWSVLSVTTMGNLIVGLDTNIVSIAIPRMAHDLSNGVSLLGWVITGYLLALACFVLLAGKIGDNYGKKRIYLLGFVLFGISSTFCGLGLSAFEIIAWRIIQGSSAAMLSANALPLIFEAFPSQKRGTAVGINGISWALGAVSGPIVGGVLVSVDWRLIFFVNVPITLVAVLAGLKRIPDDKSNNLHKVPLNSISSALLSLGVAFALISLTFFVPLYALIGIVCLIALCINEIKSKAPLFDRALRKTKGFIYSVSAIGISQIGYLGIPFALSLYLQIVLSLSPITTGLLIAPLSMALAIAGPLSGRISDKLHRPAMLSIFGAITVAIFTSLLSFAIFSRFTTTTIVIILVVIGFGGGFLWTPSIRGALEFSPYELRGVANGTTFMLNDIGFALGVAITTTASAIYLPSYIVSQIYLGKLTSLGLSNRILLGQGIAFAFLVLASSDFIAIPIFYLVSKEQKFVFNKSQKTD
jgi:EmrB/QacA subfamily drug resistance transporter